MKENKLFAANRTNASMTIRDGSANFIVAYIMQFLLQFLLMIVLIITDVPSEWKQTLFYTCLICVINEAANIITPFAYSKVLGQNFVKDSGFKWKLSILQVVVLVAISIFTVCAFSPLANWFCEFIYWTGFDGSKMTSMSFTTPSSLIIGIIFVCLLPALAEELMYRGIIARSFSSKNFIFAILMSSLIFAIMHGNPIQLVHQFFMGCVCCIVYFMTRSIYASMIVHFINNLVAVVGNYLLNLYGITEISTTYYVIIMVVGLVVLPILIYLFYVLSLKDRKEQVKAQKGIENKFAVMFASDKDLQDRAIEDKQYEENLKSLDTPEKKEVYMNAVRDKKQKNGLIDRRALIFALVFGLGVWVINTIMFYV